MYTIGIEKVYSIITGASSGVGRSASLALAAQGRGLILVSRTQEKLDSVREEITKQYSVPVQTFAIDIQDSSAVDAMFASLQDTPIDIVINNAGLALGKGRFADADFSDIETMIQTNVVGLLKMTQCALMHLTKSKGHIVNISSIAGREAYEGGHVYCGTKAFVRMLSKNLRIDLAGTGIRVTDIAPGKVETNFSVVRYKGDSNKASAEYEGWEPLRPEDIADCIAFAVSRPAHVNIDEILVMPTQQASATRVMKNS